MNKLVLVGGGGHCKVVIDSLSLDKFDDIVIVDPQYPDLKEVSGIKVVGNDDKLQSLYQNGYTNAFITLGSISDISIRQKLYNKVKSLNFNLINIIDSTATLAKNVRLDEGIYIGKNTIINSNVSIDKMCIINTASVIEHECIVEEYVHISIGSILCGNVHISKYSFVGANSTIKNNLNIGEHTIIGMGSCVIKNTQPNSIVAGNPAREITNSE